MNIYTKKTDDTDFVCRWSHKIVHIIELQMSTWIFKARKSSWTSKLLPENDKESDKAKTPTEIDTSKMSKPLNTVHTQIRKNEIDEAKVVNETEGGNRESKRVHDRSANSNWAC